jgi:putative membrane protein
LLQPQVLGVPALIPLTWLMMLPPAWAVAKLITHKISGCLMRLAFITVSALAFTAWGFYFDPVMVHLGLLVWNPLGAYFGLPWLNFTGWLLVSGVITFGVSPKRLPGGLLVVVYGLTWLVEFISLLLFWGLPGPALTGFCLMGGMLLWAGIVTR